MEYDTMLALRKLNTAIKRYVDASAAKRIMANLSAAGGWVLGYLAEHEDADIYQRDLEKDLGMCRSAVSKLVAELEQNELLVRERVASDDRLKKLVLTARGRTVTEHIRADNRRMEQILTQGFSEDERTLLHGFLNRMRQNIAEEH